MATSASLREKAPGERTLLVDALVGAVVTVIVSFVPFAPVVGGAVAGYLHREEGPRVGALSGLFASVPVAVVLLLVMLVFGFFVPVGPGASPARTLFGFLVFVLLAVLLITGFNVLLGATGGILGVALADREVRDGDAPEPPSSAKTSERTD